MPSDDIGAIIAAAGYGNRMGHSENKMFLPLGGQPVLLRALHIFQRSPRIATIVVAAAMDEKERIQIMIDQACLSKVTVVAGGPTRQESVYRALQHFPVTIGRVVVHDGARPLLLAKELDDFLVQSTGMPAATMAVEVKDTIKKVDAGGLVEETLERQRLRAVQTPQIFERALLLEAHQQSRQEGITGTDDASLLEWLGFPVRVLAGSNENIKVTTPEDLVIAEAILARREKGDQPVCG